MEMIDKIIVSVIVAVSIFFLGRRIYFAVRDRDASSGCSGCLGKKLNEPSKETTCCAQYDDTEGE